MAVFPTLDISASGTHAQTVRLNAIASNIANVNSVSSNSEDTYRSKQPVFKTIMDDVRGDIAGVEVHEIVESQEPLKMEYNPNHPMANQDGYIFKPNVNIVEEMANMLDASRAYETNIEVMNTTKQLLLRTIQLGKN